MSQKTEFEVKLPAGPVGEWESYRFGDNYIFWSEYFDYSVTTNSGHVIYEGKLDEVPLEGCLPLTQGNCYWFCHKAEGQMLYVSWSSEKSMNLKIWDFKTKTSTVFYDGIEASRNMFHNFCWLHWNAEKEQVQLAWLDNNAAKYIIIKSGKQINDVTTTDLNNPNCFYVENNMLYAACNFIDPKGIQMHIFGPNKYNKIAFKFNDDSAYTWQDFGKINEGQMYVTIIEGEAGLSKKLANMKAGHTAGLLLLNTGLIDFENRTDEIKENDDSVSWHWMDKAGHETETDLPDGFFMVNRQTNSVYATCSNDSFVKWDLSIGSDGVWTCVKNTHRDTRFNRNNYCSSWDREGLWAWEITGGILHVCVHCKANPKIQYFWLLMGVTKANQKGESLWQDGDLVDAIQMLVE